ncbi:MAG: hypothetical protein V4563_17265 [Pseudomonadota bacterium]
MSVMPSNVWTSLSNILNNTGGAFVSYYDQLALVNAAQAKAEAAKVGVVTAQQAQTQVGNMQQYMPWFIGIGCMMFMTLAITGSRK